MRNDRGVALLEVLIALAILAIAGMALVGAVSAGLRATALASDRERASVRRDELMTGLSLLSRPELDARLGVHQLGAYAVEIQHPRAALYRLAITGPAPDDAGTLATLVYRAPEADQ